MAREKCKNKQCKVRVGFNAYFCEKHSIQRYLPVWTKQLAVVEEHAPTQKYGSDGESRA